MLTVLKLEKEFKFFKEQVTSYSIHSKREANAKNIFKEAILKIKSKNEKYGD